MFRFNALADGTQGCRFKVLGVAGLTRRKKFQRRYAVICGSTMLGVHIGKRSFYVELPNPVKSLHNFVGNN